MSGYLQFRHTGVEAIDKILQAIEDAGDSYHHTQFWCEDVLGYKGGTYSHIERIQDAANDAAAIFLNNKK